MTTTYAGDYGGGYTLTCVLREGNVTVTTTGTNFASGKLKLPSYAYAAEISVNDYVSLHVDTANTYAAAKANPVVVGVTANTTPIIGRVIDTPHWIRAPAATTSTWADDLAARNYRRAVVEFFGITEVHAALSSGDSTALTVGCPLKWDLSANGWADAGTTYLGVFTMTYDANTAQALLLVAFGMYGAGSGDTDCAGYDTVA